MMEQLRGFADEARFSNWAWKGRVMGEWMGYTWSTSCNHNHRKMERAQDCALAMVDRMKDLASWPQQDQEEE